MEGNKLIDNFMYDNRRIFRSYDIDWNALIPVVEKIEAIKCPINIKIGVYISSNSCRIESTKLFMSDRNDRYMGESILETKLDATYDAIIKFIKYYNKLNAI
jgi:transcription antitermination factor NusA-like protein